MSAYWNLSRIQQSDLNGKPLSGALAYFYEAGTTTPMTVYQDASFANEHAQPVVADGYGRFPGVFFNDSAFQFFRMRVTDLGGGLIFDDDVVPIIGQVVSDGDTPIPVDQNGLLATGALMAFYGTGSRAGYVRANGRTIGSSTSGANERANSDTQPLFEHLWAADANLAVSGGRGVSAAADWAANKNIALPDARGRALVGLDDMGNTAAERIKAAYVDAPYTPILLGGSGGDDEIALTIDQLAAHTHKPGTLAAPTHRHLNVVDQGDAGAGDVVSGASIALFGSTGSDTDYRLRRTAAAPEPTLARTSLSGALALTGVSEESGTATTDNNLAHENMPPFLLVTVYVRL